MRKKCKRILCCILSLLTLLSLLPLSASAEGQISDSPASVDTVVDNPASGADTADSGSTDHAADVSLPDDLSSQENVPPEDEPLPEDDTPTEENTPPEENLQSEEEPLPEGNTPAEENTPPEEDVQPEKEPTPEEGVQPGEDSLPGDDSTPEEGALPEESDGAPADESVDELPADDSGPDNVENEAPAEDAPAEPSEALLTLRALMAALPDADELSVMGAEELDSLGERISQIFELYDALSAEEQALVDLSALESLYAAMDAQTLDYKEVSLNVTYSPTPLRCGVPIKFTVTSADGVGPFKYMVASIMVKTSSGTYFEWDRTDPSVYSYTAETNSRTYEFEHTFAASGTYYFYAYVMDMGAGAPYPNPSCRVEFTIDDSQKPSIDQKVEEIYNACEAKGFATDYEKALYYHDWIIDNAEYDHSLQYAGAGGVLCHGIGTCQSYHDAFVMLLNRSGIECEGVTGNGHIWTRVRLDGVWTLIDSTWDDTTDPYLRHMYFGLTDELMQKAHSEHKTNPDRLCSSLDRNYMIRSGEIKKISDPIKQEILSLTPGNNLTDAHSGNTVADVYYKTLCPIAAYYLANCDPDLKGSDISVSYDETSKTYSIHKPCPDSNHQYVSVPGVAPTCSQTGLTVGEKCSVCDLVRIPQETIPTIAHTPVAIPATPATCTQTGLTEGQKCGVCGTVTVPQQQTPTSAHTPVTDPAVAPNGFTPGLTEGSHCSVCGKILTAQQEYFSKTALVLPSDGLSGTAIWVDGIQLPAGAVTEKDGRICIELSRTDATSLVTYTYNKSSSDPHEVYPIGMKVWMLEYNGGYTATQIPEFADLLKYAGSSIRITGVKGIRMITGIRQDVKGALIGGGIAGYTLREYGTVLAWASEVNASSLVLGAPGAKSNFAYKQGVADPVFSSGGGMIQYTNVLVGFNNDQCKADIVMRPYIVLRAPSGRDVTVYGGVVQRSIGYIAYQNRSVFSPGSAAYTYVWDIIHHVYGNKYD